MKIRNLYVIISLFFCFCVSSQVTFQKTAPYYSVNGETLDVEKTNDGGYIILRIDMDNFSSGNDNSCIKVLKSDSIGNLEWVATFCLNSLALDEGISGISIKQTNDFGYIITGSCYLSSGGGDQALLVMKINNIGNLVWNKYYNSQVLSSHDLGRDIIQTNDGGYVIIGTKSYSLNHKVWVIKIDSNGNVVWEKIFSPINNQSSYGYSIKETVTGDLFITGNTLTGVTGICPNPFLIKTDSNGNVIWSKIFDAEANFAHGEPTYDGGYIVLNKVISSLYSYLMKLKPNGDLSWIKGYAVKCNSFSQTVDSGYVICGNSYSFGTTVNAALIFKTDSLGNVSFLKTINNLHSDFLSVKQTPDYGYIAVGNHYSNSKAKILFVKTDSIGFSGCNDISGNPLVVNSTTSVFSQTLISVPSGTYTIGSLVINEVIEFDNITNDLCSSQGILEKNIENNIKVFPNPTKGTFEIKNLNSQISNAKIKVIDVFGKCVFEKTTAFQNQEIELNLTIADGIYFIHISDASGGKEFVRKIVVQK